MTLVWRINTATDRRSAHSIVVDDFGDADFVAAMAFVPRKLLLVATNSMPSADLGSSLWTRRTVPEFSEGDEIRIFSRVAFDNRHRDAPTAFLGPSEAVDRFADMAGLKPAGETYARLIGHPRFGSFDVRVRINNVFEVGGKFKVASKETLLKKIREGLGSRKSYGYGLILINDEIKNLGGMRS
jgi:hypothetical protein